MSMDKKICVTIWNEYLHEKKDAAVKEVYPKGIHAALADHFNQTGLFKVRTATLDEPEHGLSEKVLSQTDVLLWWGHRAHDAVQEGVVKNVQSRVLSGMGLIVLHSAHFSKIFKCLLGTGCSLKWREAGERARVWNVSPGHEIAQGIGDFIELEHAEMYGEPFDVPEPDRVVFISWFQGGEVFRSGCTWERGHGRIFYFAPGHETYPIYHHPKIQKVLVNSVKWARPRIIKSTEECKNVKQPLEYLS
jgi:trehalose utilization protein